MYSGNVIGGVAAWGAAVIYDSSSAVPPPHRAPACAA